MGRSVRTSMMLVSDDGAESEYEVRGTYTKGYSGNRTNPPEPDQFDVVSIVDMKGNDVTSSIESSEAFQKALDSLCWKIREDLAEAMGAAAEDEVDARRRGELN